MQTRYFAKYNFISEIEGAHNLEVQGGEDNIADDSKDDIGGSAGEIITALRFKLKDVECQTNKSKCLICMVSNFCCINL